KDRVRAALQNARFDFPARRITVNLAPADLPKEGGRFDLAIALGILAASGQIPGAELARYEFAGELALTGALRPVRGTLPLALQCRAAGRILVLPPANADEAGLAAGLEVLAPAHLLELCRHLHGQEHLPRHISAPQNSTGVLPGPDLAEVRGQHHAKRALTVAAAGGHNLLLIGPPGTGKTMLASRLPGILPPLSDEEAVASAAVRSIAGHTLDPARWRQRPFRAPHHTASGVALVGGGSDPRPGEISLAHNGVLFLDELPEFDRRVLEVLREPLESGRIIISRAARQAEFPARFQLIAAMNPCPCGHLGDPAGRCRCTAEQISRYRARLSGPLLDRIDLHVEVPKLPHQSLACGAAEEDTSSAAVRKQVHAARERQLARAGKLNRDLGPKELEQHGRLDTEATRLVQRAVDKLGLSARAYHRVLKVARTIADLDDRPGVLAQHMAEAIAYRKLDRRDTPALHLGG
ncbi:MAG TPA: ATP-binding protein, partial [Gammaproteobacteria bacterium]|nr:ATP-binding protein [Gammaproteobacteria bacterium]